MTFSCMQGKGLRQSRSTQAAKGAGLKKNAHKGKLGFKRSCGLVPSAVRIRSPACRLFRKKAGCKKNRKKIREGK